MSNDPSSQSPSDYTEQTFTRTNSLNQNLTRLYVIASSLFSRNRIEVAEDLRMKIGNSNTVLGDICSVVSKTYAERGDMFELADDEALMMIRDLLLQHDPKIIERNKYLQHRFPQLYARSVR